MNIQSEVIGKEKHISVMGLLDPQEDRQHFVNLLHDHVLSEVEGSEIHVLHTRKISILKIMTGSIKFIENAKYRFSYSRDYSG